MNEEQRPSERSEHLEEKDTDELAEEIAQIRSEMNTTLEAIERRLSTGEMLDRLLHFLGEFPGRYAADFGRAVRENPVPVIMTGLGLTWFILAVAGGRPEARAAGEKWRRKSLPQSTGGTKRGHHKESSVTERRKWAREKIERLRARDARARIADAGEVVRQTATRLGNGLAYVFQEQPLVLGALGMAVGAGLGTALPISRPEAEWLGEAGEELQQQVRETTREQVQRAAKTAESAIESARERVEARLH